MKCLIGESCLVSDRDRHKMSRDFKQLALETAVVKREVKNKPSNVFVAIFLPFYCWCLVFVTLLNDSNPHPPWFHNNINVVPAVARRFG